MKSTDRATNHAVKTLTRQSGARSGIITLVQRFGSALNLNVHLHMIVLDGVYTFDDDAPRFHSIKAPSQSDMQTLLDRIIRRTMSQLERDRVLIQDTEQPFLDLTQADLQDTFNSASVRYRIAIGPNSGQKTLTPALGVPHSYRHQTQTLHGQSGRVFVKRRRLLPTPSAGTSGTAMPIHYPTASRS